MRRSPAAARANCLTEAGPILVQRVIRLRMALLIRLRGLALGRPTAGAQGLLTGCDAIAGRVAVRNFRSRLLDRMQMAPRRAIRSGAHAAVPTAHAFIVRYGQTVIAGRCCRIVSSRAGRAEGRFSALASVPTAVPLIHRQR